MAVAVVGSPKPSDKIPAREQMLSAGAVALGLVNAALAAGWGASWMTGWAAYDRPLVEGVLGLAPDEWIVGLRLSRDLRDCRRRTGRGRTWRRSTTWVEG